MLTDGRLRSLGAELIAALGLVFVVAGITIWYVFVLPGTASVPDALHELVMHVLFGSVILGLGLYLVSRLADVYGGGVTLEEATDGASFRVTIPTWAAGETPAQ